MLLSWVVDKSFCNYEEEAPMLESTWAGNLVARQKAFRSYGPE